MCKDFENSKDLSCRDKIVSVNKIGEKETRESGTNVMIEDDDSVINKKEWSEDLEL